MKCKTCGNIDHTTNEHEIFKDLFEKSKEDLVSIIISLEVELNKYEEIYDSIKTERERQDKKWGIQNHSPYKWMAILMEEVGEACTSILEEKNYKAELVQIAAVAVAAIESLRR